MRTRRSAPASRCQALGDTGVAPGMIVGEPGAGTGHFTCPAIPRIGDKGGRETNDASRPSSHAIESHSTRDGQNGESMVYVKGQTGRASIQITVDSYGHLVPVGNRAAVRCLDDAFYWGDLVSRVGIEPTTRRLRVCCSAN